MRLLLNHKHAILTAYVNKREYSETCGNKGSRGPTTYPGGVNCAGEDYRRILTKSLELQATRSSVITGIKGFSGEEALHELVRPQAGYPKARTLGFGRAVFVSRPQGFDTN